MLMNFSRKTKSKKRLNSRSNTKLVLMDKIVNRAIVDPMLLSIMFKEVKMQLVLKELLMVMRRRIVSTHISNKSSSFSTA